MGIVRAAGIWNCFALMSTLIAPHSVVLFQGDSITDCGRSREEDSTNEIHFLGNGGYVCMSAASLLADRPSDGLCIHNRGVAGDRIVDLYARVLRDTINLKPDVLSVLIGVNDTWHGFNNNGIPIPKFERIYRDYLNEVRESLPNIRLVLCEPFVLRCGVVTDDWVTEMDLRREVVRRLVSDYAATFVPFQGLFDEAVKKAPAEYWASDGVHPSAAGHCLMARAWLDAVA